jgi:hypothetical protein
MTNPEASAVIFIAPGGPVDMIDLASPAVNGRLASGSTR